MRTVERIFEEEGVKPDPRVLTKVKLPNNPKPVTVPGKSFRFPGETLEIKSAPGLNADTFTVLAEIGVARDDLAKLEGAGVIKREVATTNAAAG